MSAFLVLLMAAALATSNANPLPPAADPCEVLIRDFPVLRGAKTTWKKLFDLEESHQSTLPKRCSSHFSKRDDSPPSPSTTAITAVIVLFVLGIVLAFACRFHIWYSNRRRQSLLLARTVSLANYTSPPGSPTEPSPWPADYTPRPEGYVRKPWVPTKDAVENIMKGGPPPDYGLPVYERSTQDLHVEISAGGETRLSRDPLRSTPPPTYDIARPPNKGNSSHDVAVAPCPPSQTKSKSSPQADEVMTRSPSMTSQIITSLGEEETGASRPESQSRFSTLFPLIPEIPRLSRFFGGAVTGSHSMQNSQYFARLDEGGKR